MHGHEEHIVLKADECPTCGLERTGRYCGNCGEKKVDHHDYSMAHFLEEAVDTFTHFDGKFFKSVKYLLFFPGKLTADYLGGRRVKLMKPFQLYIIINLIYFFLMKSVDIFMVYLNYYILEGNIRFKNIAYRIAIDKAAKKGISLDEYIKIFNHGLPDTAKAFVILLVPILGLGIWLLYFNKEKKFIPHLIFAVHLFSFLLAFTLIYTEAVILPVSDTSFFIQHRLLCWALFPLIIGIYTYFALKKAYQQSVRAALLKTVLLIAYFFIVQQAYRIAVIYVHFLFV